jgi:hypothetical protein
MDDPTMAFVEQQHETPAISERETSAVNAGRAATPAEIDRLAEWLLDEVGEVSIISEERHEIDGHGEASIHQVRIELDEHDGAETAQRIVERAQHWMRLCVADRHAEVTDGV